MCSTGPFQYRRLKWYIYSSCYYHHQIRGIHLFHCYHIFWWSCTWNVCYIIFCHLLHIRSGKTENLFSFLLLLLCSLWCVQTVGYVLACRSYSFVCTIQHLILIIVQIYLKTLNLWNACQIYCVECVSKIKHIVSVIHETICGAVCFQFTHFSCDDWENIYTLSNYHHQIGSMNYYPLFRVRSWNNGVRCMSFYILKTVFHYTVMSYFKIRWPFNYKWVPWRHSEYMSEINFASYNRVPVELVGVLHV